MCGFSPLKVSKKAKIDTRQFCAPTDINSKDEEEKQIIADQRKTLTYIYIC